MGADDVTLTIAPELRLFLAPRHRPGLARVRCDGVSSLGHVVESLGVPLPEVGQLVVNGRPGRPSYRPQPGDTVLVEPVLRPQAIPSARFVLDVHLGALARRMRLVGLDAIYANDSDDDALIHLANADARALLTRDRWLLRRRKLRLGAYVRGHRPDEQLADVIDRFDPPLAPWTRCLACNGALSAVPKREIERQLLPGTRRTYQNFARCADCGRVYWRGAHSGHLAAIVAAAARSA